MVMQGPDGQEIACPGTYLEIVPNKKSVFTDAFSGDWVPKAEGKPFMTAIITFEDVGGQTRYTARVRHWTKENCEAHVKMGPSRLGPVRGSACSVSEDHLKGCAQALPREGPQRQRGERHRAMTLTTTLHATLVFEREIPALAEEVFAAFADPVVRTEWVCALRHCGDDL
jgi:uncharacterized protein YndB with AHSA1/START domain